MNLENSPLTIFSLLKKADDFFIKKKPLDIFYENDVLKYKKWYERTNEFTQYHSKKIYNDIENSKYDYKKILLYIGQHYLFNNKKFIINKIGDSEINNNYEENFSKKALTKSKNIVIFIFETGKLKNIDDLIRIRNLGCPVIYNLIKSGNLKTIFYLYLLHKKVITEYDGDNINEEFFTFQERIKKVLDVYYNLI